MNIKKYTLKTMCVALICSAFISGLLVANATDVIISESPMDDLVNSESNWITEESNFEEIEVTYKQSSSYFVTIPKTIALGTNKQAVYPVKVEGEIDSNQRVYVAPIDAISDTENIDFYMKNQNSDSKKAVATVTQKKLYWNSEEVADGYEETNNSVSAPDLTAGIWKGIFQMEIRLETDNSHTHNFVGGKCECGEIDPNHEHDYEDGTCTICGEENPNADPYEIAPEGAYSNWYYTLDEVNNVITLNCYIGSEIDVVVYANYVIDGKTYKTQIASNSDSANSNPRYMFNGTILENCRTIKSIIFSDDIDMSNVTDTSYMFHYCRDLISLDLGNFDTSNVKNMSHMFEYCYSLTNLDLSNFDTSNVTNMNNMFNNCTVLTSLNISSFNTSKVMNMNGMFFNNKALTSLDLSSFDTSHVTDMSSMFRSCINLKTIYVTNGKWTTSKATTTDMFKTCGTSSVTYK